ncbi:MAG: T9SS type A sorting domain-containing protein [Saprospiraceae bacterium]|nr:T9SS type A sorting domain-containing protein [Saprospiraceae bacterium]
MKNLLTLLYVAVLPIAVFSQMCELENLDVDVSDCDATDSVELTVNFDFMNTSDSFILNINNILTDTFAYSDLPVTLGRFFADCTTDYRLGVVDLADADCFTGTRVGTLCCDCMLSGLQAEAVGCVGDTCMLVEVDFEHRNVGNNGFTVFAVGGIPIGVFNYSQLPVIIPCFPVTGRTTEKILICDNDFSTCCVDGEFQTLECDSCDIFDLEAAAINCDVQDSFDVVLDFGFEMVGDSGFCVNINDSIFGPYSYDTTERVIGRFKGGCDSVTSVIVFDKELANCADTVEIMDPCCDTCRFGNVIGQVLECNGDSCLKIRVDFDYFGQGANGFNLYSRNGLFGTFQYNQLPLTIDCFPITDPDTEYVRVCDVDDPMCCSEGEFPTLDCSPPCEITDLTVVPTDCNARGDFFVDLDFMFENTSDSFYVFGNGRSEGPFSYNLLPLRLGPYPGDCRTNYEFKVIDTEDPLCSDEVNIGRICCDSCELTDLDVEAIRCNGDSCIVIEIDFNHSATGGTAFDVFSSNGYFGTFSYLQLPLTIDCYPISGFPTESIKICDKDFIDCCIMTQFPALNCEDTCKLDDLTVEAENCTGQDSFMAVIDFISENPCGDNFLLVSPTGRSFHAYSDLPITTGPYAGGCEEDLEFIIMDSVCTSCTDTFLLSDPCCDTTCQIFDLQLSETPCDNNDQFFIDIDFMHENTSDSFYVRGNGRNEGPFAYDDLPHRLGPLDGDCITEYVVAIADAEDDNCREIEVLGTVCCGDTCEISNLNVEVLRCNGDSCLVIEVDFDTSAVGSGEFEVFDRNGFFGVYNYAQLPLVIDCFTITGDTFEFIKVCDRGNPDCCAAFEFPAVDCDELCAIYDVELNRSRCDTNGQFMVTLEFSYDNVSDSFTVSGNGRMDGTFGYNDLPVALGPFDGDCTTDYDFIVADQSDPNCSATSNLGVVCCDDSCSIFNLTLVETQCDSNDMFFIEISFDHQNTSDSFFVKGNGRMEGPFAYNDLPLTAGPYDGDCSTEYEFVIEDQEETMCSTRESLGIICCDEACRIYDIVLEATDCDTNDQFFVFLDFDHEGTSDSFLLSGNNRLEGPYSYDNLPRLIGPYTGDCVTEYEFIITDLEDANCTERGELGRICCGDSCVLEDISARAIRCVGDSCIEVILDFDFSGTSSAFDVFDRNGRVGTFAYDGLPLLTIDCFPISGQDMEYIMVCDTLYTDCCVEVEFDALDCTTSNRDITSFGWELDYDPHTDKLTAHNLKRDPAEAQIELIDLTGRLLSKRDFIDQTVIDMHRYRSGVYFARLTVTGHQFYIKFVKP